MFRTYSTQSYDSFPILETAGCALPRKANTLATPRCGCSRILSGAAYASDFDSNARCVGRNEVILGDNGSCVVTDETTTSTKDSNGRDQCGILTNTYAHLFNFTGDKAGMNGFDVAKRDRTILEASKNSSYFKNEERKATEVGKKIEYIKRKSQDVRLSIETRKKVDQKIAEFENNRAFDKTFIYVDMDAFFVNVELRDDPSLKDKPVAVGGMGMISTANYIARQYGVRSAMPGFIGKKLCPSLVFVKPCYEKYKNVAAQIQEIFREYDPAFESMGLDEASLDITSIVQERMRSGFRDQDLQRTYEHAVMHRDWITLEKDPLYITAHRIVSESIGQEIRRRIFERTNLTASAGIAPNRLVAKVCADFNKPNGQFYVAPSRDAVLSQVRPLQVRKLPGIGKVTERMLKEALGVNSCKELFDARFIIYECFSEVSFEHLIRSSLGISHAMREHDTGVPRKSISSERTFRSESDPEKLRHILEELCYSVCKALKDRNLSGRSLTVKMKTTTFAIKSRCISLPQYTNSFDDMFGHAWDVLRKNLPAVLRLLGVRVSALISHENGGHGSLDVFFAKKGGLCPKSMDYNSDARLCAAVSDSKDSPQPVNDMIAERRDNCGGRYASSENMPCPIFSTEAAASEMQLKSCTKHANEFEATSPKSSPSAKKKRPSTMLISSKSKRGTSRRNPLQHGQMTIDAFFPSKPWSRI